MSNVPLNSLSSESDIEVLQESPSDGIADGASGSDRSDALPITLDETAAPDLQDNSDIPVSAIDVLSREKNPSDSCKIVKRYDMASAKDVKLLHQRLNRLLVKSLCEQCRVCCCKETARLPGNFAGRIRNPLIHVLLLGVALSACIMAVKYDGHCPASEIMPLLVFMSGIVGITIVMGRIITKVALIVTGQIGYNHSGIDEYSVIAAAGIFLLAIFGCTEMLFLLIKSPNFSDLSKGYCNKTFYYYIISMNAAFLGIAVLPTLLYVFGYRAVQDAHIE